MAARRIGQILVDLGFLTDEQLEIVLEEQEQQPGALFGKIAEDMQLITDEQLIQALAEQMSMQTVSLEDAEIPVEVRDKITETMAQLYRIVPIRFDEDMNRLTVATCDPQNLTIQDELRTFLGYDIAMVVTTEREVLQYITKHFDSESESVEKLVAELADDEELKKMVSALETEKFNITDAEALADSAPVRKLLNMVLLLAIKDHASDIHFEPFEDEFRIRIKSEA
ncbi:type IV-A pilus assembly ATPase PilB, partial [Rhodopirellula maiorica SM1]